MKLVTLFPGSQAHLNSLSLNNPKTKSKPMLNPIAKYLSLFENFIIKKKSPPWRA
jgi:hypothetical protein